MYYGGKEEKKREPAKDKHGVLMVDKKRAKEKPSEGSYYAAPGMAYGGKSGMSKPKKKRDPNVDYSKTMAGKEPGNNSKKVFTKKKLKRY